VCLLDRGNGELDRVEGELRQAGCQVHRHREFSLQAVREARPDVAIIDFDPDPQAAIQCFEALDALGDEAPPALALLGTGRAVPAELAAKIRGIPLMEVIQAPDRLVRAVRRVVRRASRSAARRHEITWLPQREELVRYLDEAIRHAQDDPHRIMLVTARVDPETLRGRLDAKISRHIRRGDFIGHAAKGNIVLAIENTSGAPVQGLDDRFVSVLRRLGVEACDVRLLEYPKDGRSAEELLTAAANRENEP
jgi:hypothetical protein